jgi:hypothetical protein
LTWCPALNSRNYTVLDKGPSRPVAGKLYLFLLQCAGEVQRLSTVWPKSSLKPEFTGNGETQDETGGVTRIIAHLSVSQLQAGRAEYKQFGCRLYGRPTHDCSAMERMDCVNRHTIDFNMVLLSRGGRCCGSAHCLRCSGRCVKFPRHVQFTGMQTRTGLLSFLRTVCVIG